MHLAVSPDPPSARPVVPVSGSAGAHRDADNKAPPAYVFRGELLDSETGNTYNPRHNLQISPENRRAIDAYRQVASDAPRPGRILNGYI